MKTENRLSQVPGSPSLGSIKPTVSVIIPTYNRASLIGRALRSVLDQTYQDFEIIVVDDGSVDETRDVIRSFGDKVRYVRHSINKGAGAARNTGIRQAKGRYLAFLDSDDEWLNRKLEIQMEAMRTASPKVGVVYSGAWRIKEERRWLIPERDQVPGEEDLHRSLLSGTYAVLTQATLVKKECFETLGDYDERLPALEELDLWIRFSKSFRFLYVSGEPLAIWHYVPGSLSTNRKAFFIGTFMIMKKNISEVLRHPGTMSRYLVRFVRLGIGHILHQAGLRDNS